MRIWLPLVLAIIPMSALKAQDASPGTQNAMRVGPDWNRGVPDRGGPDRRGALFIAPCGKPYRGQFGDPYPVVVWFAEADTNHDGRLTMLEMRADAARFFAELDADQDGEIDPDEVTRYETVIAPEIQTGGFGGGGHYGDGHSGGGSRHGGGRRGGGEGRHGGGETSNEGGSEDGASTGPSHAPGIEGPRGAGRFGLIATPEPVIAADIDLTRTITLVEFEAKAQRDFELLDNTNRGYLTLADLPRTIVQAHGGGFAKGHHGNHRSGF